jgi:hypothetical protein
MRRRLSLSLCLSPLVAAILLSLQACPDAGKREELISSRSYSGHENDQDANYFVRAFPSKLGTRLDDCQLCHRAGVAGTSTGTGSKAISNACNYCHLIAFPDSSYTDGVPASYHDTLNAFGLDYMGSGRSKEAFAAIMGLDSDGDGFANQAEIDDNRFPGTSASNPGLPLAPVATFSASQIVSMTQHSEFLLLNTTKQQYDFYAVYSGPKLKDLLAAAGVDLSDANITGVSVFAPDGFKQDFSITNITSQYPDSTFYAVPQPFDPVALNFMQYPDPIPVNPGTSLAFANGDAISDLWLTLASVRDGASMSTSYYDPTTGRQEGEGPYRIIPPQTTPGRPDRGSGNAAWVGGDSWDYDKNLDHNAGKSVRGVVVIRVNPMPAGLEEYDTTNGWSLITEEKIVIYGYGVH